MSSTQTNSDTAITIRAAEPEDYHAVQAIYAQPGAYFGTLQMPFPSAQLWKDRLSRPRPGTHMLVACVNNHPVANIGLNPEFNPRRRHSGHIGMGVHDAYVGRGIGRQLMSAVIEIADHWLNLTRLELTVYEDNDRAIRLYERNGFVREGLLQQYAFRAGNYVNALTMARLH
jgi:putative acetyltransferase